MCYVGLVYSRPHFGFLSRGEAVRDEPAQYISMRPPETTTVVPNGSHYRDSQYYAHSSVKDHPIVYTSRLHHLPQGYLTHNGKVNLTRVQLIMTGMAGIILSLQIQYALSSPSPSSPKSIPHSLPFLSTLFSSSSSSSSRRSGNGGGRDLSTAESG